MNELWRQSASDLAKRIASRQISSAEVVEAHLARIGAVNPRVNAIGQRGEGGGCPCGSLG